MQIILVDLLTQAYIFMIKKIPKYQQKLKMWCFSWDQKYCEAKGIVFKCLGYSLERKGNISSPTFDG